MDFLNRCPRDILVKLLTTLDISGVISNMSIAELDNLTKVVADRRTELIKLDRVKSIEYFQNYLHKQPMMQPFADIIDTLCVKRYNCCEDGASVRLKFSDDSVDYKVEFLTWNGYHKNIIMDVYCNDVYICNFYVDIDKPEITSRSDYEEDDVFNTSSVMYRFLKCLFDNKYLVEYSAVNTEISEYLHNIPFYSKLVECGLVKI